MQEDCPNEPENLESSLERPRSREEILKIVQERHVVSVQDDDLLDPLERTVRFLVPIPRSYYWEAVPNKQEQEEIPLLVKVWHQSIFTGERFGHWTGRNIGMPIAQALGLTESRFQYVLDQVDGSKRRGESSEDREDEVEP